MSNRQMKAMDLSTLAIDAEMVGKLYILACNTTPLPTNESVDTMACHLLHVAIDAALEVHDGTTECVDLGKVGAIKFQVVEDGPETPSDSGFNAIRLKRDTERMLLACCKAAGVNPHEFVESWIGGLVADSLETGADITNAGITADLLAKFGHQGEKDSDAYNTLRGKLRKIVSRERGRIGGAI